MAVQTKLPTMYGKSATMAQSSKVACGNDSVQAMIRDGTRLWSAAWLLRL